MKKLPLSWRKSGKECKYNQLSFADSLFIEDKRLDIFIEGYMATFSNCKWLRYRSKYSNMHQEERLMIYEELGFILDQAVLIIYKVSRKSDKYNKKSLDDYMKEIFVQQSDYGISEEIDRLDIVRHYDNVADKVNGMFLAYKDLLIEYSKYTKRLLKSMNKLQETLKHAV